jgi:UDP-glucose 4-epimerase
VLGLGHGDWALSDLSRWGLSRWVSGDIGVEGLNKLVQNDVPSSVVHCGGSGAVSFSFSNPIEDFQRAAETTAVVLDWIRLRCPKACRFVLVSSAAVYGDQGDTDFSESSVRLPVSPYGVHKLTAEILCESYSRFFGVSSSIVRLFSIYGEGLKKQLFWDAIIKFRNGKSQFFGTGNELRDWLHVEDAARLLALASLKQQSIFEVYNGGGEHATVKSVVGELAKVVGHEGEMTFDNKNHQGNPHRLTSNSSHAAEVLGWKPEINLLDGVLRYGLWTLGCVESINSDGTKGIGLK